MVMRNGEKGEKRERLYMLSPTNLELSSLAPDRSGDVHNSFMAPESSRFLQSFGIASHPGAQVVRPQRVFLPRRELGGEELMNSATSWYVGLGAFLARSQYLCETLGSTIDISTIVVE